MFSGCSVFNKVTRSYFSTLLCKMAPKDLWALSSSELRHFLNSFDTVLCDCDGVIWNLGKSFEGIKETFHKLKKCGKSIHFVSNNNMGGTKGIHNSLKQYEAGFENRDVVTPSEAIISYLKQIQFQKEIFLLGSSDMKEEFTNAGLTLTDADFDQTGASLELLKEIMRDRENIGAVVFDYDVYLTYFKLIQCSVFLRRNEVLFIMGATDKKVSVGNNILLPGPYAFQSALMDVTSRTPLPFGKPSLNLHKFIVKRYNIQDPSRVLFVGDSIEQDIEFGTVSGYQTLLVFTGITSFSDMMNCKNKRQMPNYYIDSLANLDEVLKSKLDL